MHTEYHRLFKCCQIVIIIICLLTVTAPWFPLILFHFPSFKYYIIPFPVSNARFATTHHRSQCPLHNTPFLISYFSNTPIPNGPLASYHIPNCPIYPILHSPVTHSPLFDTKVLFAHTTFPSSLYTITYCRMPHFIWSIPNHNCLIKICTDEFLIRFVIV